MHRLVLLGAIVGAVLGRAATTAAQPSTSTPGPVVSTQWLQQHLSDPLVRVVVSGQRDLYDRAHIPGARFIDHMATIGSEHHLLPADALAAALAKAGAADGTRVILYGDSPMTTGWLFMALASVGHGADVSMLDGSIELWRAEGRPVSSVEAAAAAGRLSVRPATDVAVDAAWVKSRLESPDVRVLDVRTAGEWNNGHLPGATLVLWQDLFADQRSLKFKSIDDLRALFKQAGVKPGQQVVTYCAVGMRASLMYWAALGGRPARTRLPGVVQRLAAGSHKSDRAIGGLPVPMKIIDQGLLILVAVVLSTACDRTPHAVVDGLWERGGVSGDHFGNYYLDLRTNGGEISGSACRTSDVHLVFTQVPVHGDYPSLNFVVGAVQPCCPQFIGARFTGEVAGEQTIVADFTLVGGVPERMTLHRSSGPPVAGCFPN